VVLCGLLFVALAVLYRYRQRVSSLEEEMNMLITRISSRNINGQVLAAVRWTGACVLGGLLIRSTLNDALYRLVVLWHQQTWTYCCSLRWSGSSKLR